MKKKIPTREIVPAFPLPGSVSRVWLEYDLIERVAANKKQTFISFQRCYSQRSYVHVIYIFSLLFIYGTFFKVFFIFCLN